MIGYHLDQIVIGSRPVDATEFPRFLGNRGSRNVEIGNDGHLLGDLKTRLANVDIDRRGISLGNGVFERPIKDLI